MLLPNEEVIDRSDMSILNYIIDTTEGYLAGKSKSERKNIGQFFTSKETAIFMASLFNIPVKPEISILDPGAGTGILTAALIERLCDEHHVKHINVVCYENNAETADLLDKNLSYIASQSQKKIQYEVRQENYIVYQIADFNYMLNAARIPEKFDLVIGNPPYQKIPKDAPEATAMPEVCYGAPNLYFLFAAMSLFNLKEKGEMVYIIPRSWTSGAYFKAFRDYLFAYGKLHGLHLFVSRDKVFEKESVLQETIIIKIVKQNEEIPTVVITSSQSNSDFHNVSQVVAPYNTVISGTDKYVYLITSNYELNLLNKISNLKHTLPDIGLKMKTGLTVDFRNRELLRECPGDHIVPLFYAQHIQNGRVIFPAQKDWEYISDAETGLIQSNKNYLFVKRFTSKEEKRRLQCGIYLCSRLSEYQTISTQNKINFIDRIDKGEISDALVYGLYVIFNSTVYDQYYRILNGSTQVNSTEVNAMPVPDLASIISMGQKLIDCDDLSTEACDKILGEVI